MITDQFIQFAMLIFSGKNEQCAIVFLLMLGVMQREKVVDASRNLLMYNLIAAVLIYLLFWQRLQAIALLCQQC